MAKSIHWIPVMTIIVALAVGVAFASPIAFADNDDVKPTTLLFRWDPADSSSDPKNAVVVSGIIRRMSLPTDASTDVKAELNGKMVGKPQNVSEETVTKEVGSATITTTLVAKARNSDNFKGTIQIDGQDHTFKFKPQANITILGVTENFTSPTTEQTSKLERITVSGTITMCSKSEDCFEGFGTIRRDRSSVSSGSIAFTFIVDTLEAEIINDTGLYELRLTKSQRITSP